MTEWIENKGNDCPVPPETMVEVKFVNGKTNNTSRARIWEWGRSSDESSMPFLITHCRIIE